jgi:DNA-directed RNA polymerase subunit RPC12/RpoP
MAPADGLRRTIKGLSEAEFRQRFGTEEACREALFQMRWREGLSCPGCGHRGFCALKTRKLFQCNRCKKQVRLMAGTVFQDTKLPLTTWFAAIYHLTQSKGGISSIELGRRLGVKQGTAWLMKHKLMRAMAEREARAACARLGGSFSAVVGFGRIDHAGDDRCRAPTPLTYASACSLPVRPVKAARLKSHGASGSASGRSSVGSKRRGVRAGAGQRCRPAAAAWSGVRWRRWPGWWTSRTTPRWPSMPSGWRRARACGAALPRSAGG